MFFKKHIQSSFSRLLDKIFMYKDMHPAFGEGMRWLVSNDLILKSGLYYDYVIKKAKSIQVELPGVTIETILNCNAKCQMCGHSNRKLTGLMKMDLYRKIIDDCHKSGIRQVELSIYGEPSLDPWFIERVEYLRSYRMKYNFTTNGSRLTKEMSRRLINLGGLTKIHFSANALDPDIYHKMMGGKLTQQDVYQNLFDFLELKKKMGKSDIWVVISTVKLYVNQGDIAEFTKFWQKQKMVNQIIRHDLDNKIGAGSGTTIGKLVNFSKIGETRLPCRHVWERLHVYHDGRVGVCCQDWDRRQIVVGDMNTQSIAEINDGPVLNDLRRLHSSGLRHTHPVCGKCNQNIHWFHNTVSRKRKDSIFHVTV